MGRNAAGIYNLPAGSTVVNGETSDASDINTPLADIETDANTARPIVAGGTGAATAAAARTNLGLVIGTDVQAQSDVLDDLDTLGAATANNEFLVATGAGVLAWEAGATARGSLNVGEFTRTAATVTDWDDADAAGMYESASGATNEPVAADLRGIVLEDSSNQNQQILINAAGTKLYIRGYTGGAWGSWRTIGTGIGETTIWRDVSGTRATNTNYQNTAGYPIEVYIRATDASGPSSVEVSDDAATWVEVGRVETTTSRNSFIVPRDSYYRVNSATASISEWTELR